MNDKLPFMPLYVFLWQTDEAVRLMDCDARGVYVELMMHQWIHGTIPSAPDELATMLPPHREASLERALRNFEAERSDPSRCFNSHLRAIRNSILSKRSSAVEAGRKGGIVSGLTRRRVASSDGEATLKRPSSIASPSLVGSNNTVAENGIGEKEQPANANPIAPFGDAWTARFDGVPPWARIGKALKALRALGKPEAETLEAWKRYLEDKDEQFANPQDFVQKYGLYARTVRVDADELAFPNYPKDA